MDFSFNYTNLRNAILYNNSLFDGFFVTFRKNPYLCPFKKR